MPVLHVVSFKYNSSVSPAERHLIASSFLALKDTCISTTSNEPYILELTGGAQNSTEGADKGFEHTFIVTFASEEDRDFYVSDDKAHDAFKGTLKGKLDDVHVVDFTPGVFEAASKACKLSREFTEQQQQLTHILHHRRVT